MLISKRKIWFLIILLPLAGIIVYFSWPVITPFILSFFLAYAINPLVEFFEKKGARRDVAVLTVYIVLLLSGVLALWWIIPGLTRDLLELIKRLPKIFDQLQQLEAAFMKVYWRLPPELQTMIIDIIHRGEALLRNSLLGFVQGTARLLSQSVVLLLVPLLAFYINRDYPRMKLYFYRWIMTHLGNYWTRTFLKIDEVFKLYIRCQLLDIIIVGLLIGIGLHLLGFEAAFLLGMAAGILNIIPYFGPVLGALPPLILGLLHSPWQALYVILLFLIINQLEVMFISPRIMSVNLKMHPVLVVYFILMGGKLLGFIGMIFAVPLGAILLILLRSIYELVFNLADPDPISADLPFDPHAID